MKKKKYLILALTVSLMTLMLCACGGGSSESTEVDNSPITADEISELYTNADSFTGRTYDFTGRVFDIEKDGTDLYLQVYQDIKNYENNTVVVYPESDVQLKQDDYVRISGTIDGTFSGENAFGGDVAAPKVTATKVEKIDAMQAFPANKSVDVNKTVEQGDYKATVSKVDFTDEETRIYLKVVNDSSATFDNYPDQGVIVQNGTQYEAEWSEYYPEPSTSLKGGASSESVITFPLVEESDFSFSFNGYTDDYDEVEFNFDITVE